MLALQTLPCSQLLFTPECHVSRCSPGQIGPSVDLILIIFVSHPDTPACMQVGQGEFGTVHLGSWLGATVAIKVLKGSTAVAVGDFRRALSRMHPRSVKLA